MSSANFMGDKRMKGNDESIMDPCVRRGDIIIIYKRKGRTVVIFEPK